MVLSSPNMPDLPPERPNFLPLVTAEPLAVSATPQVQALISFLEHEVQHDDRARH